VQAFQYGFANLLYTIAFLALFVVKGFAFIDAIFRPAQAFLAADRLTKTAWLWITGLSFVAHIVFTSLFGLFSIIGIVAAFVYLLDVRPALSDVMRRR
jgi:hypothetical protein